MGGTPRKDYPAISCKKAGRDWHHHGVHAVIAVAKIHSPPLVSATIRITVDARCRTLHLADYESADRPITLLADKRTGPQK
jgi:hypothetical protein